MPSQIDIGAFSGSVGTLAEPVNDDGHLMAMEDRGKYHDCNLKRPEIGVIRLDHGRDLPLPAYETVAAAGMDLRAACTERIAVAPGARELVPTGLVLEIPDGFEGQVRPRSGLALKHGVTCLNTPGTIDADYRGEVMVLLINHGLETFVVERGMRVAQLVIAPAVRAIVREHILSSSTPRGSGGFGSTGL